MTITFIRTTSFPVLHLRNTHAIASQRPPRFLSPSPSISVPSRITMTASTPTPSPPPPLYAVAPMMDVTDRHYRALARLISRRATLYTEMVVDRTLIHNQKLRFLELRLPSFPDSHPVVLQLGGSEPQLMRAAAEFTTSHPYTEININCGCPSPKVADNGCFGAALMRSPAVVADIVKQVSDVVNVPVTVKCRLGLDWDTSFEPLRDFVKTVHEKGGVQHFIVHARNAVLGGLSPAKNRSVPPLRYEDVYRLVEEFPHIHFSINGGIRKIEDVLHHLQRGIYGVMVGRAAMDAPWQALCEVDQKVYGEPNLQQDGSVTTRRHVLRDYVKYGLEEIEETGCSVRTVIKPLLNLFYGERNGKQWRREIDNGLRKGDPLDTVIDIAIKVIPAEVLDALPGEKVVFPPPEPRDYERVNDSSSLESAIVQPAR